MTSRHPGGPAMDTVLVLDVDGVLLDPERAGKGRWQNALHERYGFDPALLDAAFFQRSWSEVIVGRQPIEPALAGALAELGWDIDVEAVLSCWFEADFEVDHEVVRAVSGWVASGVRVALATNQEARRAGFLEVNLGAIVPIGGIAYSGAIGSLKSDPSFYPAADDRLGIGAPTKVVFVDDSLENVKVAQRHGWLGIHFDKESDWEVRIAAALGGSGQ